MAILASMMEIGDDMERQRILDHSSVSHPEFTGTYTPCKSLVFIFVSSLLLSKCQVYHCGITSTACPSSSIAHRNALC